MKYSGFWLYGASALAVLLATLTPRTGLAAQENKPKHLHYRVIDLGTFGGPQSYLNIPDNSYARVLNRRGSVVGWADTSIPDPYPDFCFDQDCLIAHAFKWKNGTRFDLGTLPGGASSQATWITDNGLIAGVSQNGEIDPLIPSFPELRAVLWDGGKITDLGTLDGGHESVANAVNSRRQVVGAALNATPDANSMFGLGYEARAFLWQDGTMQDLGTLGGTDAIALLLNERGQIVGDSYTSSDPSAICSTVGFPLTTGAFIWEKGRMLNLGNFGGTCTFALALNNRGQVVGGSRLPGDEVQHPFLWEQGTIFDLGTFGGNLGTGIAINDSGSVVGWATYPANQVFHAFLWKDGKKKDLGNLPGDSASFAFDVNDRDQVVGISVPDGDFSQARAFLWEEGGPMVDLNALIPPVSGLKLETPANINARGEIAVEGSLDGNLHAFLLVPEDANSQSTVDGTQNSTQVDGSLPALNHAPVAPVRVPAVVTRPTHHSRGFGVKQTK
jgi:probable HAF family extracellular repeat protein